MTDMMYNQMKAACDQIGVKILSDDTCCKLLAVVYAYGDESAVYSDVMRHDIRQAQERAGIWPGRALDQKMIWHIADYAHQIESGKADWLGALGERYGMTFTLLSDWRKDAREHWKEYINGGVRISPGQHRQAGQ